MKKAFRAVIIMCLLFTILIPQTIFASTQSNQNIKWYDANITDYELNNLLEESSQNTSTHSSDLINEYSLAISKKGSSLVIVGRTNGSTDVTKCGFSSVIIQRRKNSKSSWSDYQSYTDLTTESRSYLLSKTVPVASGYQYRVTAVHYAKKNLFSTQKINNTSNILTF